jgi:signal transduction histidine kinase
MMTPTAVREQLEQQSAMLRITIHELRRPLGVVDGWLSMIQDGSLEPLQSSAHAEQAFSAMSGDPLWRRPYQLRRVVASAVAAVEHEARSRQISVDQGGPEVEAKVDPDRLRIALVNLVANAIRHSPAGSVVEVVIRPERGAVTIAVSDDGPGIAPADAAHIFDPWYQGEGAPAGLGLGLWIVRTIVEWHRGRVTLESTPGHGATFHIVLPRGDDATEQVEVQGSAAR